MAEDIDQKIVLAADTAGGEQASKTVAELGKDTSEAAKHATKLMKTIGELMQQLDGMKSDAAQKLREELSDLAKIINSLDVERLKHLDGVLSAIEKTGAKITGEGAEKIKKNVEEVKKEATSFWQTFSNNQNVVIRVKSEGDDLQTLTKQLNAIDDANDFLDTLDAISKEAKELDPENAAALAIAIRGVAIETKGLSSDNVGKFGASFEKLLQTVSKLPVASQKALKSFDVDTLTSKFGKLKTAVSESTKEVEHADNVIGSATDLISGNFDGVIIRLKKIVEQSKIWQSISQKIGFGKAALGLSAAVAGVSMLIGKLREHLDVIRAEWNEMKQAGGRYVTDTVEDISRQKDYVETVRGRKNIVRDAAIETNRAKFSNERAAARAKLAADKDAALLVETDPEKRRAIEKKYERDIATADYNDQKTQFENAKYDRAKEISDLEEQLKNNAEAKRRNAEAVKSANANVNALGSEFEQYQWYERIGDAAGLTSFGKDKVDNFDKAQAALKTANDQRMALAQEEKDINAKIAAAKKRQEAEETEMAKIEADRTAALAAQKEEDAQHAREVNAARLRRQQQLEDRNYEERDAQFEMDQAARRRAGAYGAEIRNAEYKKNQYEADLAESTANLAEFNKTIAGKKEEELSPEELAMRDRLEGLKLRDQRNLRSATNTLEDLKASRAERMAEFREGTRLSSNRLTAMGLGGDVVNNFGKETAGNTKTLVELTKTLVENSRGWRTGPRMSPVHQLGAKIVGTRWNMD